MDAKQELKHGGADEEAVVVPNHLVSGKILHKESATGIPDLLVELFDIGDWGDPETNGGGKDDKSGRAASTELPDVASVYKNADRVGSVTTDASGSFSLEVPAFDFNSRGGTEQKPDLFLVVLAPDEPGLELAKRVLYVTTNVRFNASVRESYLIRLPTALLRAKEIPFELGKEESQQNAQSKVSLYVNQREREKEFNAGAAEYHGTLNTHEATERAAFRGRFIASVATDYSTVPLSGVFAREGDNIAQKNIEVVKQGVARANSALGDGSAPGVPVNLYLTLKNRNEDLKSFFDNATGFVEIPESAMQGILFRPNSSENPGTLLIQNNPVTNYCVTESFDAKCAKEHAGVSPDPHGGGGDNGGGDVILAAVTDDPLTKEDIPKLLGRILEHLPTPDSVQQPELSKRRADAEGIGKSISEFSLTKGPAEIPAFYDFNRLEIAFDHVWKQMFDENLPKLAFTANTLGKAKFGVDSIVGQLFNNGRSWVNPFFSIGAIEVPPVVASFFDITKEEFNDMSFGIREQLLKIANAISARSTPPAREQRITGPFASLFNTLRAAPSVGDLRVIQSLTEQGERLIDSVRHDDYYTLHRTLRDLHTKLNSKYEFTIFGADKDSNSVNFGLLNTWRQQWIPLTYQAGNLVKTVAMAPGEERRYSVKVSRKEKRTSREARRNNSSLTSEQQTISRVEAEIMAKAQNKTNFGLSAEGEYDIGISEGKATTTFGVEALNESAKTRKDFREAVLKAIQEYKAEISTEVVLENIEEVESSESGVIMNPNAELAVTYLFYELQKRYRVFERLHRVMPVVLVAQEVPSPDQITAAWVISNDWIINRHLLDDSFRPTLRYLASNSVGDDFCLRELRKNLKQQRSLVETLRIEFSAASVEADNRYKALEAAIRKRIDEEHNETTDGLFSDIGEFFGGDGQDPEAAKARELAAKDAHQYALEKAERASAALREEVSTLHSLTKEYNKTLQARLDAQTQIERLLVHIRNNIFYYMQAIWSMEPPDQRFLRLHKVQVPVLELESRSYRVEVDPTLDIFAEFREAGTQKHRAFLHGTLKHSETGAFNTKSLVEVADLNALLGFKGNYMIFPMKQHNALTEFMAAPYIDTAFGAMDPDELSNVSLEEYSKYVCCLHDKEPEKFEALKEQLKVWLKQLLATPLRNGDEIVVPTGSLFIQTLVDKNAILEDFKLKHRELDVFKVQEEVRHAALENLRLAARLLNDEREDPDIEKKIVVLGKSEPLIGVEN